MSWLEKLKEKLKSSQDWLPETEKDLSKLKTWTGLGWLAAEVQNWIKSKYENLSKKVDGGSSKWNTEVKRWNVETNGWKFEYKNDSQNKEFSVYLYTVKKGWRPKDIRRQAKKQGVAKKKGWILITDINWRLYDEYYRFSAWDEVYVKVPKKISGRQAWNSETSRVESSHNNQRDVVDILGNNLDSAESSDKRVVSEQWMYDKCIEYWVTDRRQIAYILATVKREAPNSSWTWFKNRIEVWKWQWQTYWNIDSRTWYAYYGRGFVMLTHKSNYKKLTKVIHSLWKNFKDNDWNILKWSEIDLVNNPDIILKSNELSALLLFIEWNIEVLREKSWMITLIIEKRIMLMQEELLMDLIRHLK